MLTMKMKKIVKSLVRDCLHEIPEPHHKEKKSILFGITTKSMGLGDYAVRSKSIVVKVL